MTAEITPRDKFLKIASSRKSWANSILVTTLIVLIWGFAEIPISLNYLMGKQSYGVVSFDRKQDSANNKDSVKYKPDTLGAGASSENKDNLYQLGNFFARMAALSVLFFLSQLLIRLYKYNMGASDYYHRCADAIDLSAKLPTDQIPRFVSIFSTLTGAKVEVEVPDTPSTPGLTEEPKVAEKPH